MTCARRRTRQSIPFVKRPERTYEETGLNYYGARHLDPKTSSWLSADPALGEYIPVAPVNDEAKKHNQNLPGMGGVFNTVNLHLYHYAGNNPIKYTDPDGRKNKEALQWMKENLKGIPPGYWYFNPDGSRNHTFKMGEIPTQLHCYQSVFCAYANADRGMSSFLPDTRWRSMQWFKAGGTFTLGTLTIGKKFEKDITKGEVGDIVFLGNDRDMEGHAVLLDSIKVISDTKIEIDTFGAYSPSGDIGPEK